MALKATMASRKPEPLPEINGYRLLMPLSNKNSGFARWAFASKNGREYFIKEFLSPVCPRPSADVSAAIADRARGECEEYFHRKNRLYQAINASATGNIVLIRGFFLFDTKFYIVTDKVDTANLTAEQIASEGHDAKLLLFKVIAACLTSLHKNGVVHSDLKPSNILIKRTATGSLTAKLIDFDGSYIVGEQPQAKDIQGDQLYYAPETCKAIFGEDVALNQKVDVFALGLLFHQYYTGVLPGFDTAEFDYAYEALLNGGALTLSDALPGWLGALIASMLEAEPLDRPDCTEVFNALQNQLWPPDGKADTSTVKPSSPTVTGDPWKSAGDL